jgi:hypothetical protein
MAKQHYVHPSLIGLDSIAFDAASNEFEIPGILDYITKYVNSNLLDIIKYGDIIHIDNHVYDRWDFIWDGLNALHLDFKRDDYGAVPDSIKVSHTEFSPYWWSGILDKTIFYLSDDILQDLKFYEYSDGSTRCDIKINNNDYICYIDDPRPSIKLEYFETTPSEDFKHTDELTHDDTDDSQRVYYKDNKKVIFYKGENQSIDIDLSNLGIQQNKSFILLPDGTRFILPISDNGTPWILPAMYHDRK